MIHAILLLLTAPVAAAGTTDDAVPDARYVAYAKGFAPYTAKLDALDSGGRRQIAAATLISDKHALTAAHVVDGVTDIVLTTGSTKHRIETAYIHPEWAERLGRHDIAVLRSEEPFGLTFYPPLSAGEESVGEMVSICGYGVHGKLSTGYTDSDGRLRAGTNTIERIEGSLIVCLARRGSSPLEFCISPGDSGGPLFCRGRLAGVNSITMKDKGPLNSREGEESGHVRVSLYREWIEQVMKCE